MSETYALTLPVLPHLTPVVEEQGGFRRGKGCREQIVSLILVGQTKVALQEDGFLAAFIDFSKA